MVVGEHYDLNSTSPPRIRDTGPTSVGEHVGSGQLAKSASGTRRAFAIAVLKGIQAPLLENSIDALIKWMGAENTNAAYNPMATTRGHIMAPPAGNPNGEWVDTPVGNLGATIFNSVKVRNYASFEQGVQATVETMNAGYHQYKTVLAMLRNPAGTTAGALGPVVYNGGVGPRWGTGNFGNAASLPNAPLGAMAGDEGAYDGSEGTVDHSSQEPDQDLDAMIREIWGDSGLPDRVEWEDIPPEFQETVLKELGWKAAWLQHPEIGPLMLRAALSEQEDEKTLTQLMTTQWWKTSSKSQREWEEKQLSDPTEVQSLLRQRRAYMTDAAGRAGIEISAKVFEEIVVDSLRMGYTEAQILDALVGESMYDPNSGKEQALGDLRTHSENLRTLANSYGLTYSDQIRQEMSRKITLGELDEDDLRSQFISDASGRFPHFSKQFEKGFTLTELMDTRANEVGRIMGIDPQQIDFLNDPDYQSILEFDDGTGNGSRAMNLLETKQHIAKLPAYEKTEDAHQRGSKLGYTLLKKFGAI